MPRTIPSLEDFIKKDLLPTLNLSICSFRRQESDQFRLATSIKKQRPILFSYDDTSRQDSKDIIKRFAVKGIEHQVNVIIVRSKQTIKPEQNPKTRKPRRPKVHRVHIKEEAQGPSHKDPRPEEDDSDDFDLPPPSEVFQFLSQLRENQEQEIGQEINQEVDQAINQEIDQAVSQEIGREGHEDNHEVIPANRRRRRAASSTGSIVSPPRTRKRYQLKSQDHERMQASGPTPPSWSRSQD
jgi:hypothetical protein